MRRTVGVVCGRWWGESFVRGCGAVLEGVAVEFVALVADEVLVSEIVVGEWRGWCDERDIRMEVFVGLRNIGGVCEGLSRRRRGCCRGWLSWVGVVCGLTASLHFGSFGDRERNVREACLRFAWFCLDEGINFNKVVKARR